MDAWDGKNEILSDNPMSDYVGSVMDARRSRHVKWDVEKLPLKERRQFI